MSESLATFIGTGITVPRQVALDMMTHIIKESTGYSREISGDEYVHSIYILKSMHRGVRPIDSDSVAQVKQRRFFLPDRYQYNSNSTAQMKLEAALRKHDFQEKTYPEETLINDKKLPLLTLLGLTAIKMVEFYGESDEPAIDGSLDEYWFREPFNEKLLQKATEQSKTQQITIES